MSPPDEARLIAGLRTLAGPAAPDASRDPDVLKVALITQARQRGATWAQVGTAILGVPDGKLAKKAAKSMAARAERKLLRAGLPGMEVPR